MPKAMRILLTSAVALGCVAAMPAAALPIVDKPLVIGHRGASGYRPEHTLAAYELAIDMGADYVEPDLVSTKDGILIARHEPYIGGDNPAQAGADSTDVASRPEFADRKKSVVLDGLPLTGWFVEDFTLAELKTLRANERLPALRPQSAAFNGQFEVPTLQEVIDLVKAKEIETGRKIGIYPETKHPTYHDGIGLSLEEKLVEVLTTNGYDSPDDLVFIQSFEVGNLKELAGLIDVNIVQLSDAATARPWDFVVSGDPRTYGDLLTPAGLAEIATYANGIGPFKALVIPRGPDGNLLSPTSLVDDAHALNLLVHAYTFRSENNYLPTDLRSSMNLAEYGDYAAEYAAFFAAGLDGLFSDNPDHARRARDLFVAQVPAPATLGLLGLGAAGLAAARRRRG